MKGLWLLVDKTYSTHQITIRLNMELLDKISALEEEASQFGFKWQSADQIMIQIHSECDEIKEHLEHDPSKANQTALQEEIGDLLHAVFSLCIFCKLSP
jgi:NTP pyrophosphatase (non-canonical NTP hydrolase)